MFAKGKKDNIVDLLFIVLLMSWLYELDFTNLTPAKIVGLFTAGIWCFIFIKKSSRR